MTRIDDLHRRWRKDAAYKGAYDELGDEFELAGSLIEAKTMVRLSRSPRPKKPKTRSGASRESTRKRASID